eukprot:scaffold63885_cov54-Attheya_sp.AAC.9
MFRDKLLRYTYLERDTRGPAPTTLRLEQIRTWAKGNEDLPSPNKWLVMNADDFNRVKLEYSKVCGNSAQHGETSDSAIGNIFRGCHIVQK